MRMELPGPMFALLLAAALPAQDASQAVFRSETRLMQVEVKVRDKQGRSVRGLSAQDFRLSEDGEAQSIVSADYVEKPRALPRLLDGPRASAEAVAEPEPASAEAPPRLWVYIANQSRDQDFEEGLDAIEEFIRNDMVEGMTVSIAGSPFLEDRDELLRLTELMRQNPNGLPEGPDGYPVPSSINMLVEQLAELELEREATHGVAPQLDPRSNSLLPIDHLIQLNNRMALFQMLALVRQLSAYPGKKAVMLMRGGLRWDVDNSSVSDLLVGEANRNRISFYTMDTRGLEPIVPVADPSVYGNPIKKLKRGQLNRERLDRVQGSQQGLEALARGTGGKAVVNSNDYGLAFRSMLTDAGDYYLLSYTPTAEREEGLLRRIKVEAVRGDWDLEYSRRYYEQKPFEKMSRGERSVHLYRAMEFDTEPARLGLRFDGHFFRDLEGRTVFVYSSAVHPSEVRAREDGAVREVAYSVAAKAAPKFAAAPAFSEITRKQTFEAERFEASLEDANAFLQHRDQVALKPGAHDWRIAWRDDLTGRIGRFVTELEAPDLSQPAAASSLLVTRRARALEADAEPALLDVGGLRLEPESPHEVRAGDTLYVLYDLYEVDDAMLDSPPPMRFALMFGKEPAEVQAKSQAFVGRDRRSLRYLAVLETADLEPGTYTALALLPGEGRKDPYLYSTFEVMP